MGARSTAHQMFFGARDRASNAFTFRDMLALMRDRITAVVCSKFSPSGLDTSPDMSCSLTKRPLGAMGERGGGE